MQINYLSYLWIAFLPIILTFIWYKPDNLAETTNQRNKTLSWQSFSLTHWFGFYMLSLLLVYGYANVIVHQMGFYELFFTDIMKGDLEAQRIVDDFLLKYGDKHRHFGHGVLHGVINTFIFVIPILGINALLRDDLNLKSQLRHALFWITLSAIIGGCIAQFL